MQISDHRAARAVNVRLQAAGIYFFAAFTTAVSVDDLMYMASAGGHPYQGWWHTILVTSLVGSLVLAGAFIAALVKPRYGYVAGLVGACLAWPYFVNVACNLPWRNFVWLITIHWDGKLNVEAATRPLSHNIIALTEKLSLRRQSFLSKSTSTTTESAANSPPSC